VKEPYKTKILCGSHPLTGHCYVASEVAYHLFAKDLGYKPYVMRIDGDTHWFLKKGGEILDLTQEQFSVKPQYESGRATGFLTKQPSRRAKEILSWLQQ
jgi:hypothetical protein